jgi:Disulphide bond corrector protein DsbC
VGKIKLPEPNYKNGHEVYQGKITMSQTLQASSSLKPGNYEIKGKVIWQACKSDLCLPPITGETMAIVNIQ